MSRPVLVLAMTVAPGLAAAEPTREELAQRHVDAATVAHDAGRLADATTELTTAYALDPRPELLYAIGQVETKAGNCGLAIAYYNRYLATKPESPEAGREAIATCKRTQPLSRPIAAATDARRRIDFATALHQNNQFAQARNELAAAYALDPQPALLYALGQLQVKLDACDVAIYYYDRFIAEQQDAGATADATQAIEVCKTRLAQRPDAPATTTAPAASVPRSVQLGAPSPWYTDGLALGLAGGALALTAGGAFLYVSARGELAAADDAATYPEHADRVDRAGTKRTYAAVLGIGAVALTAAAVYRFVRLPRETRGVAVTPAAGGAIVTWGGGF
jgi:tetratricopeptide (TPR) repeat protein